MFLKSMWIFCLLAPIAAFADDPPPVCSDENIFGVWLDAEGDSVLRDKNFLGEIVAYQGGETMAANYHYQGANAHLHHGPALNVGAIKVFMYQGSDGLSLFYVFGRPGVGANKIRWAITTTGNEEKDKVILSDDAGELRPTSSLPGTNAYDANHNYNGHTDGGVIGPFVGKDFLIRVKEVHMGHSMSPGFYSDDGKSFSLDSKSGGATATFLIAHSTKTHCDPVIPPVMPLPASATEDSPSAGRSILEYGDLKPRPPGQGTDVTGTDKPIPVLPDDTQKTDADAQSTGPEENVYNMGGIASRAP
jgi:hypothetical protein